MVAETRMEEETKEIEPCYARIFEIEKKLNQRKPWLAHPSRKINTYTDDDNEKRKRASEETQVKIPNIRSLPIIIILFSLSHPPLSSSLPPPLPSLAPSPPLSSLLPHLIDAPLKSISGCCFMNFSSISLFFNSSDVGRPICFCR